MWGDWQCRRLIKQFTYLAFGLIRSIYRLQLDGDTHTENKDFIFILGLDVAMIAKHRTLDTCIDNQWSNAVSNASPSRPITFLQEPIYSLKSLIL
jgi:hypothetical protein